MRFFATSISTTPTSTSTYEAEAVALFAEFTNTYTTDEKDSINQLIIDLKSSGVWDKTDHLFIGAMSGAEEQLLDWKNPTNVLTKGAENVTEVPYRGLAPQTGYYSTNSNPTTDSNISLDSAFISFKAFQGYKVPHGSYFFGIEEEATFRLKHYVTSNSPAYAINFLSSTPYYVAMDMEYNDTVVFSRENDTVSCYAKGVTILSKANTRTSLPNGDVKIGGVIAENGQSNPNYIQHLAWGSGLTVAEAQTLTTLIDDFCNVQSALSPYLQTSNYKVYTFDHDFKAVLGEKCLYNDKDKIYTSNDLGKTVRAEANFDLYSLGFIEMCKIFDNEKVIFATSENKIYKTTLDLTTVTEIFPQYADGSPYTLHTPINPTHGGNYFKYLGIDNKTYLNDGREIFVYNNYANVWEGASPVFVWYSFGDELKVAFEFGQNPYLTDTGIFIPSLNGNLLGDASQSIMTRHGHGVEQRPDTGNKNIFMSMYGDYDRLGTDVTPTVAPFYESKWLKHVYDETLDTWTTTLELEGSLYTKVKGTGGQMPNDGYIYYASDLVPNDALDQSNDVGYWKVPYADLGDIAKHTRFYLQNHTDRSLNYFYLGQDGFFMGGGYAAGGQAFGLFGDPDIIWSDDMSTFNEDILPIAGNSYFYKITKISNKRFLLNAMIAYNYGGSFSIILDFN